MGLSYNKGIFEFNNTWDSGELGTGYTEMIGWYKIPEGFKIENLDMTFGIVSSDTKADSDNPPIKLENIGYYSVFGLYGQMGMDIGSTLNTEQQAAAGVRNMLLEGMPSYFSTENMDQNTVNPQEMTGSQDVESSYGDPFGTTSAVGWGHHKAQFSPPHGKIETQVFFTNTHKRLGVLYGKGMMTGDDKQRFMDSWSLDLKTFKKGNKRHDALYANSGNGAGVLGIFLSIPETNANDAWSTASTFQETYFIESQAEEDYDAWVNTFDAETAFTPQTNDTNSDMVYPRLRIQNANPVARKADMAVRPQKVNTYLHFDNLVVSPIDRLDSDHRHIALNAVG